MSAQGKPIWSGLVLGILFLALGNKNQKKAMMIPLSNHWLNIYWLGSLNPCQVQILHLGQETNSRQIILHRNQETRLK